MDRRTLTLAGAGAATVVLLLSGGLLLFGGSGSGDATTTTAVDASSSTTTSEARPSTTTEQPTTTQAATTTRAEPLAAISVTVDGGGEDARAVEALYAWIGDPTGVEPPPMSPDLAEYLATLTPVDLAATGSAATAEIGDDEAARSSISVAVVGDGDVVLGVDDGDGWRIVGAKLASMGGEAWYGPPIRHVFVIGTDARPGQSQPVFRGDSLHVLASNLPEHAGAIMGFPRDTYVVPPYGGADKFTNVNALAGPDAMVDIAREMSGLPIEGYIVTGFVGFEQLVNDFGGVVVDVPFAMAEPKSNAYLNAGRQVLWGANALAFSRNRTIQGGDFTRSYHQGLVVLGALEGTQSRDISELPMLLQILDARTWTSLSAEELLTLAAGAWEIDPATVLDVVLPGSIATRGGASVVLLDEEAAADIFADMADGVLTPPADE